MTIYISGGAKNGKSTLAQELAVKLAAGGKLYYVATMLPSDEEDMARITRHREERAGLGFETVECGRGITSCLGGADAGGTYLVDSVTALLMNELFPDPADSRMDEMAPARCASDLADFVRSVGNVVLVSDYIFSDAAFYDEITETFRWGLARIDRTMAELCDAVAEVSAGVPVVHKGELPI